MEYLLTCVYVLVLVQRNCQFEISVGFERLVLGSLCYMLVRCHCNIYCELLGVSARRI